MLGALTRQLIDCCCPADRRQAVSELLATRCARDLPGIGATAEWDELIDRIQLAAIRGSDWDLAAIACTVALANVDWRDVLVAGGFAGDLSAHRRWQRDALLAGNVR